VALRGGIGGGGRGGAAVRGNSDCCKFLLVFILF
jgi:hypothetical protein